MNNKPVLAVIGATGAQGGSLVEAALEQGFFHVRALTRNPGAERAQALAARGAEVVQADVGSGESLRQAFEGASAAFCVTFFWDHFSPERELEDAQRMAEAASAAGVRHVIWSTLEDTRRWIDLSGERMPTLLGKYKVPHFDAKGQADGIFRKAGVPVTFLRTSFYWDNFINFGSQPQRGPDGVLTLAFPMGDRKLPGIAACDIGRCALGIFGRPELIGQTVGIAGEHLTGDEMAAEFSSFWKEPVRYFAMDPVAYRALGFPGAEDLGNMFQFKRDFNEDFCRARSVEFSRSLNPELLTFRAWLAREGARIPRS
jgi:uncharacterized protein YbjT (DUF2867 family)